MNVLAIDYGDRRVGLAYANTEVNVALPLIEIPRSTTFWDRLMEIIREYSIDHILVGLPINLESKDTIQTQKVRNFYESLKKQYSGSVELLDERMTSALAKRYLSSKSSIDVESARILLEEWLLTQYKY